MYSDFRLKLENMLSSKNYLYYLYYPYLLNYSLTLLKIYIINGQTWTLFTWISLTCFLNSSLLSSGIESYIYDQRVNKHLIRKWCKLLRHYFVTFIDKYLATDIIKKNCLWKKNSLFITERCLCVFLFAIETIGHFLKFWTPRNIFLNNKI